MTEAPLFYDRAYFEGGDGRPGTYGGYGDAERASFERLGTELARRFAPKRALDVGCAHGYLVGALAARAVDAYGVDISEFALAHCDAGVRNRLAQCDLRREALPFPNGHFDLVCALGVLEYVRPDGFLLSELSRVAAPGARLLVRACARPRTTDDVRENVLPAERWLERFAALGFSADPDARRLWRALRRDRVDEGSGELARIRRVAGPIGAFAAERWLAARERSSVASLLLVKAA